MKRTLRITFMLLACWHFNYSQAQTLAGGEIYYELTGPKKFKVTAHIYRSCSGAALNSVAGYVFGSTYQVPVTFTRTAIKKINDTCGNPCKIQNAVSTPGFEKHTFEATVDFNSVTYKTFVTNNVCNVNFAIRMSGRSTASTHNLGLFYLDAGVNICDTNITQNHSPVFTIEPKFYAACNLAMQYSPGPLDTLDYDSLGFEMVPIQSSYNTNITYFTNYSGTIPLSPYCPPSSSVTNCKPIPNALPPRGFYFDNMACQMVFTPVKCADSAYVKIKVTEYRRNPITKQMVSIGFVTREMMMRIRPMPNNNLVDLINVSSVYSICKNDLLVTLKTKDIQALPNQTKADTTTIFWNRGYKPSTFTVIDTSREKSINITLKNDSSLNQSKRQYFTVAAYDKLCNISLVSKSIVATDYPSTKYKITKNISGCNVWHYKNTNPDTFNTNNIKTTVLIFDPSSKIVFTSVLNADSFTFNNNGRHIIEYTLSNNPYTCNTVVYDTITINNAFIKGIINSGRDSTVCSPYITKLKFQPYKSSGMVKLEWFRNDTLFNIKDSIIPLTLLKDAAFKLKLTDNRGCMAENKVTYFIKQHNALLDFPLTQCKYTLASYTAIINTLKAPITYKWNLNGKDTTVTGRTLSFVLKDTSFIRLTIKDSNNCVFKDSIDAYVKTSFSFQLKKDKKEICTDSALTFTAGNITASQPFRLVWKISKTDSLLDDTTIRRNFKSKQAVILQITDANSCTLRDSIVVVPVVTPKFSLPKFSLYCPGNTIRLNPAFNPNTWPKTYQWKLNDSIVSASDSFYMFNLPTTTDVTLRVSNRLGCYTESTTKMELYPVPNLDLITDTNYHHTNWIKLSTNKPFKTYQWFNTVSSRNNEFWASSLGAPGKYRIYCTVTDSNDCLETDSVNIYTNKFVGIQDIHAENIKIYPNPGQENLYIETETNGVMSIINAEGKTIMDTPLIAGINMIQTNHLAPGIYIIRIHQTSYTWMKE